MFNQFMTSVINKRRITLSLVMLLMFFGVYSYFTTPKQESPDVSAPAAVISCIYPGASSEDVEKMVTEKIEYKIREIPGYNYSYSTSSNNFSYVIIWLHTDVAPDASWDYLRRIKSDIQGELPKQAYDIEIDTNVTDTSGVFLSISSDSFSLLELEEYTSIIQQELTNIDGVSKFELLGNNERNLSVIVDYQKLNYYNMSLVHISNILQAQNIEIPTGSIVSKYNEINVKTPASFTSLDDISSTIVKISSETGQVVRLKDVASLQWTSKDSNTFFKHNGKNALLLSGYFEKNKNVVSVGEDIKSKLSELKTSLPHDVNCELIVYQPDDVSHAISKFMKNLIIGIILVVIIVFIGMSIRNAIIISTVIPSSILISFIFMKFFGVEIHEISTAGLIIALGMLVDNAIVISDAIQVKINNNEEKMSACINGVKESAIPVFSATLTTIVTFMPLILLTGPSGDYVFSVPFTVICALSISYINAIFVTPTMAYIFFKENREKSSKNASLLRAVFRRILTKALKYKKSTLLSSIGLFALAVILVIQIGFVFFPYTDKDLIYMDLHTPSFSTIENTSNTLGHIEDILDNQSEIIDYFSIVGDGFPKFYVTMLKAPQGKNYGQIVMKTDLTDSPFKDNAALVAALQEKIDSSIDKGQATIKLLEHSEPSDAVIKVRINSNDLSVLRTESSRLIDLINTIPGTTNVRDNMNEKTFEYNVDIKSNVYNRLGISKYDIQRDINYALKGVESTVFKFENNEYDILVKSNIDNIDDLKNLPIHSLVTNENIILKQIADISLQETQPQIHHYNGKRSVSVLCDVEPGYNNVKIQESIEEKYLELDKPENIKISYDGEKEKIDKYFGEAIKFAGISLIIIYFILMIQFNSFLQPLIVLYTVPLSIVGSIIGLFIFNTSLSFTALLGIISLIGIVVNNAILIIEHINHYKKQSASIEEALLQAFDRRFKPIMLTTITTTVGLLPLALSKSSLFVPMAIALISGLLIATFLTLIFIPVLYAILMKLKIPSKQ